MISTKSPNDIKQLSVKEQLKTNINVPSHLLNRESAVQKGTQIIGRMVPDS